MYGINEIKNFNLENTKAQEILKNNPVKDIDKDYETRQRALDAYLKAKYGQGR